ncbi:MAG: hypothetical protein RR382_06355 [Tannerellaceae bacterium]
MENKFIVSMEGTSIIVKIGEQLATNNAPVLMEELGIGTIISLQ